MGASKCHPKALTTGGRGPPFPKGLWYNFSISEMFAFSLESRVIYVVLLQYESSIARSTRSLSARLYCLQNSDGLLVVTIGVLF